MGAIPHTAVTSRSSSNRGKQNFRGSKGSFFSTPPQGKRAWIPLPNDSFKASSSPPVSRRSPPFFQQRLANKQLFIQRIKPYHQWLRTAIPLKAQLGQFFSDNIRIQGPPKGPILAPLHPVSTVKERYRKGGKCKISRVLQSPVSSTHASPRWRPVINLSRFNTFLHVEKFKMKTPESIRTP